MNLDEIVVRKDGDKWGAFYNDKRIVASGCKGCVINAVVAVTKKSSKYKTLTVLDEEGQNQRTILLGITTSVRPAQTNL